MKIIETNGLPVRMWLEEIEDGAMAQIENLAKLPFAHSHIAIMPDSHQGYGMPIGGVLATTDVIVPNAVGVDIGCGMCAVKTSIKNEELSTDSLKEIMGKVRSTIPVGFNHQKEEQDESLMPNVETGPVSSREYKSALKQIGTLGGGNHFIEVQKGSDGFVWIMIHSGSRNIGKQVAEHYNDIAVELNRKYHSSVPEEWELAFLPVDSDEGRDYIKEMNYCLAFAFANRKLMMENIKKCFPSGTEFDEMINIAHNYASLERHFGKDVWVHRKGATLATKDTIGIIPGSQGTKSYIVRGKGNPFSFNSCSHGAGRKMGRKEASRTLNLEEEIRKLDSIGVVHGIRTVEDLDEAAGAYKDIDTVMRNQEDLVEIMVELTPFGVIKA